MVIAIDGPAGAGKSTVARQLAARLGYPYVETGATYRAVALLALRRGVSLEDAAALERLAAETDIRFAHSPEGNRLLVAGPGLQEDITEAVRAPEVAQAASRVSTMPGVRREMVALQRRLARAGGVVMEGRDIGSVVFPEADLKVFLDASPEERGRRRFEQNPQGRTLEEVVAEVRERDRRDRQRAHSPLLQAPGAVYLESTELTAKQVVERILELVELVRRPGGASSAPTMDWPM